MSLPEHIGARLGLARAYGPRYRAIYGGFGARPRLPLAVVTCMDARLDPHELLGLREGDAQVMRNAGGLVTDDMLRSLIISQRELGTSEVLLLQHTRCGMGALDEDALGAGIRQETGSRPHFGFGAFTDVEASVRAGVARIRSCPWLPRRDRVVGAVFDLDEGVVRVIGPA